MTKIVADKSDENLLIHDVSDEALEAAGGHDLSNYTLGACSGLSVCPA
jgi:hypothetical protein